MRPLSITAQNEISMLSKCFYLSLYNTRRNLFLPFSGFIDINLFPLRTYADAIQLCEHISARHCAFPYLTHDFLDIKAAVIGL